jgi:hypothetical protein
LPRLDYAETSETAPSKERKGNRKGPGRIALELVEKAVQLHEENKLGRRKLDEALPGLTEYQAGQILKWYRVGRPAGLWLDEHKRLKWGAAISTTRDGVRLPRLS